MLAQFALIVFGIFAVMSLVIDMGYVTLTRVQMQNVADAAAVEGVRLRDVRPGPSVGETPDPFVSDCLRRSAAHNLVSWTYDDDFDLSGDDWQFGAGPRAKLTGGTGELNALQLIEFDEPRVYKPNLQRNQSDNLNNGDMVSGTFTGDTLSPEDPDYTRDDFNVGPATSPGASGLAGCPPNDNFTGVPASGGAPIPDTAFLVRLRRANDFAGLDAVDDVSSSGSALPLLFGQGTTIQGADPNNGYSVRHHGFTVRGTAIAQVAPTLRVGLPHPSAGVRGLTPFELRRSFYENVLTGTPQVFAISASGEILNVATVGTFAPVDPHSCDEGAPLSPDRDRCGLIDSVGKLVPPPTSFACSASWTDVQGYSPIDDRIPDTVSPQRIIGFGRVTWSLDCTAGAPYKVSLSKRSGANLVARVAPANTSGVLTSGLPAGLTPSEIDALRSCVCKFSGLEKAGLMCPAGCPFPTPTSPSAPLSPVLVR